jgi:hypothetical protein
MGFLTTFTVYNDGCAEIPKNAQEFADQIYRACSNTKGKKTFSLGCHANLVTCQKTLHADSVTIYVHAGNTVTEMNYFSQEAIDLMHSNREFFKEMLDEMIYHTRELKKEYKLAFPPKPRKTPKK